MRLVCKLLIASCVFFSAHLYAGGFSAEYYQIEDSVQQKEEFIRQMKSLVDKGNDDIRKD